MWETEEEMTAELLAAGCIVDIFTDENDEVIIAWDLKKLEALYPEVFEAVQRSQLDEVEEAMNALVDKGLAEMSFQETEDGGLEPVYSLTEAGRQVVESGLVGNLTDLQDP